MKLVRVYTGPDGESHVEQLDFELTERDRTRSMMRDTVGISFVRRIEGAFSDFHNAPRRQFMLYLTARVELGLGDGSSVIMEPGDVLLAEDTTGRGHTSRVLGGGMCAVVPLTDEGA